MIWVTDSHNCLVDIKVIHSRPGIPSMLAMVVLPYTVGVWGTHVFSFRIWFVLASQIPSTIDGIKKIVQS